MKKKDPPHTAMLKKKKKIQIHISKYQTLSHQKVDVVSKGRSMLKELFKIIVLFFTSWNKLLKSLTIFSFPKPTNKSHCQTTIQTQKLVLKKQFFISVCMLEAHFLS